MASDQVCETVAVHYADVVATISLSRRTYQLLAVLPT